MRNSIRLPELHRQKSQPLANVVVQLSGNPAAFLLLRLNQLTAHLFRCLLGQLLIGDVDG